MTLGLGSTGTLVSGTCVRTSSPPGIAILGSADADDHELPRDYWARNVSLNKYVKVYIGAPGAAGGADKGYVPISTLKSIAVQMRRSYPSFGGVMLWDASQAYGEEALFICGSTRGVPCSMPIFTFLVELILASCVVSIWCSEWEI